MSARLIHADCLDALATLEPESIHAIVTDPPYGLGFMGQHWDNSVPGVDYWRACLRVLKPGAHLLAFAGTRTYHRMACAIEDAGFEIRDMVTWHYGSGFPKSHDVSKAIDRHKGCERTKVRIPASELKNPPNLVGGAKGNDDRPWRQSAIERGFHEAVSDEAVSWRGWGTALKPASEPIVFARKPLCGTVAENVLRHGTGALNIDACRIGYTSENDKAAAAAAAEQRSRQTDRNFDGWGMNSQDLAGDAYMSGSAGKGRWPANVCHDGSEEVLVGFPQTASGEFLPHHQAKGASKIGTFDIRDRSGEAHPTYGDSGSAARFFYCAKATTADRDDGLIDLELRRHVAWQTGNGAAGKPSSLSEGRDTQRRNTHPTVKPTALMQWLVRLVTPPGGMVLDPFMGTGSTGRACVLEGFDFIGIEREAHYVELARLRIAAAERKAPSPTIADLFANLLVQNAPSLSNRDLSADGKPCLEDAANGNPPVDEPRCNPSGVSPAEESDQGCVGERSRRRTETETAEVQALEKPEQCASAAPIKVDDFEIPAFLRRDLPRAEVA
ncbi:MAG TPA: DNA methyltransferase [Rhizomicrobium sp.]|nr:DNA methyltransferase [Rhizomicrobium sp.]